MNPEAKREWTRLLLFAAVFAGLYFLPLGSERFEGAVFESLHLARDYAREHVVLCLLPAFWIAGAIAAFVSQAYVMITRMESDPTLGIHIGNQKLRDGSAELDKRMGEVYPGWPQGYWVTRIGNGRETHIAAWRLSEDPVLKPMVDYGQSLSGDYAKAIRSGYIRDIEFR